MRSDATQKHSPNLLKFPPSLKSVPGHWILFPCFLAALRGALHPVTGTDTCQLCLASSLRQDKFREARQHWDCPRRCYRCFQLLQLQGGSKQRGAESHLSLAGQPRPQQQIQKAEWVPFSQLLFLEDWQVTKIMFDKQWVKCHVVFKQLIYWFSWIRSGLK